MLVARGVDVEVDLDGVGRFPELPGLTVGDHPVVGHLGSGGMGVVSRVRDRALGRDLAAKSLRGDVDNTRLAAFVLEARVTGQLQHPNIVPVHEFGVDEDGRPFFTMRRIQGYTLEEVFDTDRRGGGPQLRLVDCLRIFLKVCDAVAYAHDRGVVHNDIKPTNIMVGRFGAVYLVDWGICHVRGQPAPLAAAGRVAGTPAYMAPEVLQHGLSQEADHRVDVYALGAILYEILVGDPALSGRPEEVLESAAAGRVIPPRQRAPHRDIPWELEAVVGKAMAVRPADRYRRVQDVKSDVEAYLDGRILAAADYGAGQLLRRFVQRHRVAFVVAVVAVLVLLSGSVSALARISSARAAAEENLRGFRSLVHARHLDDLQREAREDLWPPYPEQVGPMQRWLRRAAELRASVIDQGEAVAGLTADGGLTAAEQAWLRSEYQHLLAGVDGLSEDVAAVGARLDYAKSVRVDTVDNVAGSWADAREQVAADPAFPRLALRPVIGLRPLGVDPDSGLWEFADAWTGTVARDGAGELARGEDAGVVYVLIPANKAGTIGPMLVSKYEITVAQAARVGWEGPVQASGDRPVEYISWHDATAVARRVGGRLPTEAEWVHLTAAGGDAWFADDVRAYAHLVWEGPTAAREALSVGSLGANPFGLHDVLGNVGEWCSDPFAPGAVSEDAPRVVRGGSYITGPADATSQARLGNPPGSRVRGLGLRVVRDLEVRP